MAELRDQTRDLRDQTTSDGHKSSVGQKGLGRQKGLAAQKGLGGWLILVGLLIALSLVRQLAILGLQYGPMLFDGSWESLTHPGQPHYHPLWKTVLLGEIAANALFLALWAYIAYLFLARRCGLSFFLRFALILSIAFIIIEAFVLKTVLPGARVFAAGALYELAVYLVLTAIFVPYALFSRRMKETFVN